MPPETDRLDLTDDEQRAFGDVIGHYEIRRHEDGYLIFTCARCRVLMGSTEFLTLNFCAGALRHHARNHGVRFAHDGQESSPGGARRRGLDRAGRPTQSRFAFDYGDE